MKRLLFVFIFIFQILQVNAALNYQRIQFERQFVRNKNFSQKAPASNPTPGTVSKFWVLTTQATYRELQAVCILEGEHTYIFQEIGTYIDGEKANQMLNMFEREGGIRKKLRQKFGVGGNEASEWSPGVDGNSKIFILISDLGDFNAVPYGSFNEGEYDVNGAPVYPIDGYYTILDQLLKSQYDKSNEKEIIYINSNLFKYISDNPNDFNPAYSVLAREYFRMIQTHEGYIKHVIASQSASEEELWIDFGMAGYAEMVALGNFNPLYTQALASKPWTSTIMFENSLGNLDLANVDIAKSALFFRYLDQKYGAGGEDSDLLGKIIADPVSGIDSIASKLTKNIKEIMKEFSIAFYLNDIKVNPLYVIFGLETKGFIHTLTPREEVYNEVTENIQVTPRILMQNKSKLRMGGSVAYRIGKKFWPESYLHFDFTSIDDKAEIFMDIFIYDKGVFKKHTSYTLDKYVKDTDWNELFEKGDELIIIFTDVSNNLKNTDDYLLPWYGQVSGETEEEFTQRLSQFFDSKGRKYKLKFNTANLKIALYPSPFVPDYIHINVVGDGQISAKIKKPPKPDTDEIEIIDIDLIKINNTEYRYGSSFKADQTGRYTAEVTLTMSDNIQVVKNYVFDVYNFELGKNIFVQSLGGSIVLNQSAAKDNRFLLIEDEDYFQLDSMNSENFIATVNFPADKNTGLFRQSGSLLNMVDFIYDNEKEEISAQIQSSGIYRKIQDNTPPEITVIQKERNKILIKTSDISPVTVEIFNKNRKILKTFSNETEIDLSGIDGDLSISAVDYFNNKTTEIFRAPSSAPAVVNFTKIYPNPATDMVNFEIDGVFSNIEVRIYDTSSRFIKKLSDIDFINTGGVFSAMWFLDDNRGRKVSNGVYFYKIMINGKERFEGKMAVIN